MVQSVSGESAERPLKGAVLCFTSVGPEERTRYADLAIQMGAEHKLDLTSDTTHLIVGSTDTLKYQYVAKEREDIKVLRPEWIEAVRECWIKDLPLDLEALARQYRMPTLAGLKICITGFDDLSFRAQLQRNVVDNGGEYTGDLTKDVTHLIAAKPEGKKYEYGMQWQKKVVSLKWYKDTLERGMQLDEKLYHPTVPVVEQGIGAWNRRPQRSPQLGKRTREEGDVSEPSRKLSRTASARLRSQNQSLWTDIVGGGGCEAQLVERPPLKPSISMSAVRKTNSFTNESQDHQSETGNAPVPSDTFNAKSGFLQGQQFIIKAFDERKEEVLRKILVEHGAVVIIDNEDQEYRTTNTFVILPHDVGGKWLTASKLFQLGLQAVSELWLERCMLQKSFISPETYPLGQLISESLSNAFSKLIVNATGFNALETLHISKIVTLLGGKYAEVFTSAVSILISKTGSRNGPKLDLAQRAGIPTVSEEWLWWTIRNGRKAQVEGFLVQKNPVRVTEGKTTGHKKTTEEYVEVGTILLQPKHRDQQASGQSKLHESRSESRNEARSTVDGSKSFVPVHDETAFDESGQHDDQSVPSRFIQDHPEHSDTETSSRVLVERPLQELSSNSSGKTTRPQESKKASVECLDGTSSMQDSTCAENAQERTHGHTLWGSESKSRSIQAISGAIQEFLDQRTAKKPAISKLGDESTGRSRLVGRALSNLSNSSATSNFRRSRASSVDSINTDGIGSEIGTMQPAPMAEKGNFSFKGRAKTTLAGLSPHSYGVDDLDMSNSNFHKEAEAPPMTQLGYEDPEEAILLREKLAESRRKNCKAGPEKETSRPPARPKQERKIRDDDMLASAGWGTGRRTRHKQKSPPCQGIEGF
ncbi:uncharacterized protein Z518_02906 [Rhinocladiella mackenziei CBS 650.93]|uniref:BRCT domain-containing protein n=1 Tax=Rhinocladiella mackenziei CBS 650.93 TaxID=1442369 RepID=A0A0D2JFZ4_9EURO|nr:uncharacterized protein Z518_02906 [Rhinocladiella mackenziei CBS 650.93]KIX08250.1 hypothetical protein Z518_02906 [Rhinocladiella mackenziei CBS 650.93]